MPLVEPEAFPLTWEFALGLVLILVLYLATLCPCMFCWWVILRWVLYRFQNGGLGFINWIANLEMGEQRLQEL